MVNAQKRMLNIYFILIPVKLISISNHCSVYGSLFLPAKDKWMNTYE